MEIFAAKNQKNTETLKTRIIVNKKIGSDIEKKNHSISLRINTLQYDTLHNYLLAMHNVSDYTFSSISDILRHILAQLENHGLCTEEINDNEKKQYVEITIRIASKQKQFWQNLPYRNRRKILEKAILAFSKNKL